MGLLSWLFGQDPANDSIGEEMHAVNMTIVNPATGLPMANEAVDVMGNLYGFGEPGGIEPHNDFSPGFGDD